MFIDREGRIFPPGAAELVEVANSVRFYLCVACLQLIEVPVGDEGKHECDEANPGRPPASPTP